MPARPSRLPPVAAAPNTRSVAIRNRHPRLTAPPAQVRRALAVLDAQFRVRPADVRQLVRPAPDPAVSPCPAGELSVVFLTDAALARLHGDFLADPTTTDVITFEGDPLAGLAGEICVSADTARAFARRHGRDFAAELTLYLVHGWLHLAGYDDLLPARKRRMRAAEARALRLLAAAGAMPAFRLG
jgi:probable rRNA maturation factor